MCSEVENPSLREKEMRHFLLKHNSGLILPENLQLLSTVLIPPKPEVQNTSRDQHMAFPGSEIWAKKKVLPVTSPPALSF